MSKIDMSKISKKSKMIAAVAFVIGVSAAGATAIHAASDTTGNGNPMSSLVSAISQKFNLNSTDVQTVVDQVMTEQRAAMQAKHQQEMKDRLAQAVTSGKLTQEQADKISAKQAELEQSRPSLADMKSDSKTKEERQAEMKSMMDSLKQWATDNNIPQEYIPFAGGFGGRGHGGPGLPGFGGPQDIPADTSANK